MADLVAVATGLGWLDDDIEWIVRCDRQRELSPPEDETIQQASESFRYEHDLLTAEETETWLAERDLAVDDFQLHCERMAVAEAAESDEEAEEPLAVGQDAGLDEESWRVHLWLSGRMAELARRCSWLVLAAHEAGEALPGNVPEVETWRSWEGHMNNQRERLLDGGKAARLLEARRWALTRVTLEVTDFADDGTAREAELCLAERSTTMDEIVAGTGASREVRDCLVHDLEPLWQERLISIPVEGVLRLVEEGQPPRLIQVLSRTDPSLEDDDVRTLITERLIEDVYGALERDTISWEHPLLRLT